MMRVTRFVLLSTVILAMGATAARAQAPLPAEEGRFYAGLGVAATLGNKSGSSVALDLGGKLTDQFEVFIEGGRMGNVGTANLDARADAIAGFIKGTATTVQKATFFDIGVKYRGPVLGGLPGQWRPYIGVGFGTAKVETQANFSVNGTDVTADLLGRFGIDLGADLSESLNKTFIVVPIGIQGTFMRRLVADVSYRYGRISPKPDVIDQDVVIPAQRVQFGVGVRF